MGRPVTLCTCQWADLPFDELCVLAKKMGYDGLEVACWGNGIDIDRALTDDAYVAWIKENLEKNGLIMKALACHIIGQCVGDAPDPRLNNFAPAALADQPEAIRNWGIETMKKAPAVAEKFGVKIITGFTGSPIWRYLYSFPQTTEQMVEDGFDEIVRLWSPILDEFKKHGVVFALEVHPGEIAFDYYSTKKLLAKFADRPEFGLNFDPSHLIWQGMDPCACIREIGKAGALFHFHAKDTRIDPYNTPVNGVLDTQHYSDEIHRSWIFRSVGYGNDMRYWKDIVSNLRLVGYDYVMSIEHEDSLMSQNEGLTKAVSFLKEVMTFEDKMTDMWWA